MVIRRFGSSTYMLHYVLGVEWSVWTTVLHQLQ
jgi:hypothetical protein